MLFVPEINLILNSGNTEVIKDSKIYNLEIVIDLSEVWEALRKEMTPNSRIQVISDINLPVLRQDKPALVSFSVVDYFSLSPILDKQVVQYGYFEGDIDKNRKVQGETKIWLYQVVEV